MLVTTEYPQGFKDAVYELGFVEGIYSNRPKSEDPGGETFYGISRRWFSDWAGWRLVDKGVREVEGELLGLVLHFYWHEFWVKARCNEIYSMWPSLAKELFKAAVNVAVSDAVIFLQTALNLQNHFGTKLYKDLKPDGVFGSVTFSALSCYLEKSRDVVSDKIILLNCFTGELYIHYKNNELNEANRGWFKRLWWCNEISCSE